MALANSQLGTFAIIALGKVLEKIQRLSVGPVENKGVDRIVKRFKGINRLFLFTVILPTLAATTYYGLIASDVYVSESSFVVRSPQKEAQSGLFDSLLQGTGLSRSQDDTYAVNDYMLSRDALDALNRDRYFDRAYSGPNADFIARFPAFDFDRSFEALFRYYKRQVDVTLDSTTSITTLTVDAFSAEDAHRINERLLELAEQLVNRMNDRARQDLVRSASDEVARAESRVKEAAAAVSTYRNEQSIFDPDRQSALQLQQVAGLQEALITSRTQLAQLLTVSPENPQIPALRSKIGSLEAEMAKSSGAVVGGKSSYALKAPAYERLILEREFAEKQLASAMASLETARLQARRQQLYLERVSQPNTPDKAIQPKRLRAIIATLLLGLIAWGSLSLLIASIREHRD
ncbi:hypothetical protein [Paraburkholderia strydomiana]